MTFAVRPISPGSSGGGSGTLIHVYRSGNLLSEIIPAGYSKMLIEVWGSGGDGGGGNGGGGGGYVRSREFDISASAGLTMVVDIDLTLAPPTDYVVCRVRSGTFACGVYRGYQGGFGADYFVGPTNVPGGNADCLGATGFFTQTGNTNAGVNGGAGITGTIAGDGSPYGAGGNNPSGTGQVGACVFYYYN